MSTQIHEVLYLHGSDFYSHPITVAGLGRCIEDIERAVYSGVFYASTAFWVVVISLLELIGSHIVGFSPSIMMQWTLYGPMSQDGLSDRSEQLRQLL